MSQYFNFTKNEINAILLLVGLIFTAKVTPYIWTLVNNKDEPLNPIELQLITKLKSKSEAVKSPNKNVQFDKQKSNNNQVYPFDPNQIGLADWQKLGLSKKQAQSILNYIQKGGKFKKTEDLKKMYVISPEFFVRIKDFVHIKKDSFSVLQLEKVKKNISPVALIEINSADSIALMKINGIGPAFAKRIVGYRMRLGGFVSKLQLMEVYGIDSLKFKEIEKQIYLDVSILEKININSVTFDEFKRHPYLSYKEMNAVLNYRLQHGNFSNLNDLKKVLILRPEKIDRIAPYLQF